MRAPPLLLAFLIYATILWSSCNPAEEVNSVYYSETHRRQQKKLHSLAKELLMDAEMKIKAVQRYRDQYHKSLPYQLGDTVYQLRHFFKIMVIMYQSTHRNISYDYLNHNENIATLIEIHRIATELNNKVIMVHTWRNNRETRAEHHNRMKAPMRSGPNRNYDDSDEPLREVMVRERMARGAAAHAGQHASPPASGAPAPARGRGSKRKNKKWRHVSDHDFE